MADKGDHPGIHIDPTDFYKDAKKEVKPEVQKNKEQKNLNKEKETT